MVNLHFQRQKNNEEDTANLEIGQTHSKKRLHEFSHLCIGIYALCTVLHCITDTKHARSNLATVKCHATINVTASLNDDAS